ncbi:hypothetical protein KO494_04405 [Lacinutrix sp. C3R15]|uniref:peptide-N-glycosidase F-related protein n=1 Tax=Flavobacteriaceae TaxID=49546 RepID=UPI001C09F29E|nr:MULTISPECIES: peptide-N-glycosidase F-related protein [Flavobacteriaceae]MBU2938779.1 hypothetical protein [Lacinutrix sp. C3R15]MDO6622092.1 peptide-N-glycosidase F-related protein [Oceanihabitans sp. 1_MG-2023]
MIKCNSDDDSGASKPQIVDTGTISDFGSINVLSYSSSQIIEVKGTNLSNSIIIDVSTNFEVSLNDSDFGDQIEIAASDASAGNVSVYVRFSPLENSVGAVSGTLTMESSGATTKTIPLSGRGVSIDPVITSNITNLYFEDVNIEQYSEVQSILVNGDHIESDVTATTSSTDFEVSLDNVTFLSSVTILADNANEDTTIYVRFSPSATGDVAETLTLSSAESEDTEVNLYGNGLALTHNYVTFDQQGLANGGGYTRFLSQSFDLHTDLSNIEQIKMFVQIDCPTTGCDDWDRFANVKVKDQATDTWFELGRYVTPYWTGTQQLERGLEFDVTDFKSLLTGTIELRIFIENWTSKADLITVEFDYIEGTPDYPYYAVSEVLGYHGSSINAVPYGVEHDADLDKQITVPANAESTHLRTVISGWGHAGPNDSDGRPCAEWCYRTHDIKINGANTFVHSLEPLGCASNPVSDQSPGNWTQDRAGWCPGMAVPTRVDLFDSSMAGSTFNFEYDYEDWENDMSNGEAYYATSTYVIVKSNTEITAATIVD